MFFVVLDDDATDSGQVNGGGDVRDVYAIIEPKAMANEPQMSKRDTIFDQV